MAKDKYKYIENLLRSYKKNKSRIKILELGIVTDDDFTINAIDYSKEKVQTSNLSSLDNIIIKREKEKEQLNKVLAIELDELDSDLREKMTSRELVFNGKLLKVKKDTIVLPNNKEAYREWIEHNGACAIVYVDEDDNILLEKQFRYPFGRTLIELPAGKLDSVLEDHKECAIREFREETGLISKDMTYLGETGLAIAYSNEVIYIYYTNKVEQGETEFDSDEFLSSFKIPFDKALEMCNNGEIIDSKTIIGINLYNNLIRNKNK